jgi:uncharacterized lipoprotein YbaY
MTEPLRWIVHGELTFDGAAADISGAVVRVRALDVSRTDAPSIAVGEFQITALPQGSSTTESIPFELEIVSADPHGTLSLHAHVDVDHDGRTSVGDFITMQHHSIRLASSEFHQLHLRRVG